MSVEPEKRGKVFLTEFIILIKGEIYFILIFAYVIVSRVLIL